MIRRNHYLDRLRRTRNITPEFYDPTGAKYGMPTFPYHMAPAGMATRRQLRDKGLCPGGHEPEAQILWPHKGNRRVAYLYDLEKAVPKRVPTQAQLRAVANALRARMTCPSCPEETALKEYCIPKSLGCCPECHERYMARDYGMDKDQDEEEEADWEAAG
jgi:hypothetical protein